MTADMARGCTDRERNARRAFRPQKPVAAMLPKAAVRRLFDQAGGITRSAARLGYRGESQVYAMADPNDAAEISFAQVVQLTDAAAPAAAEYLAATAGGVFLPLPPPESQLAILTASAMREAGQAAADLVVALEDGLTPLEAARALIEIEDAVRAWSQLRSRVADVARAKDELTGVS